MIIMNRIQCKSELFIVETKAVESNSLPSHQEPKSVDSCRQNVNKTKIER